MKRRQGSHRIRINRVSNCRFQIQFRYEFRGYRELDSKRRHRILFNRNSPILKLVAFPIIHIDYNDQYESILSFFFFLFFYKFPAKLKLRYTQLKSTLFFQLYFQSSKLYDYRSTLKLSGFQKCPCLFSRLLSKKMYIRSRIDWLRATRFYHCFFFFLSEFLYFNRVIWCLKSAVAAGEAKLFNPLFSNSFKFIDRDKQFNIYYIHVR